MEHALTVVDGESLIIDLIGRRVAYSVFGEVSELMATSCSSDF